MDQLAHIRECLRRLHDPLALLEGLFAFAPVALQVYRRDGTCLLVNGAFRRVFGAEPPPEYNVLRDEIASRTGVLPLFHRAFAGETVEIPAIWYDPRELRQVRVADARRVAIETTVFPLRDAAGEVAHVVFAFRDVTETFLAIEALRRSEEHLAKAQELAHLGSWESGLGMGDRLVWSKETHRIFGLDESTFDGRVETFFSRIHPDDLAMVRSASDAAIRGEEDYEVEHRIVRPDGSVRWVHERADVERDPSGRPLRLIGTVQDVTESRLLGEQLRQSQKMEAVGRLAGGIAHDFNNLLTAILGYTHLLGDALAHDPALRARVEQIRLAGESAASLTRQLLAFSRKQVLRPVVLDLNDVVSAMQPMLERLIGEDVRLGLALSTDLGPVRADRGQVEQVLLNLVVNARDAMPRGGRLLVETLNVELDESYAAGRVDVKPGVYALLAVTDTGTGMDAETVRHLFEPFFTTKAPGRGTGLGLATAYGIVRQSDGHVTAYSEPGHGATFKVYLPLVSSPVTSAPPSRSSDALPRGSETVLLVEDDAGVRHLVCEVLKSQGYRVLDAADPEEALRLAETHEGTIDLLISDVVLPGESGPRMASRLRALRPGLAVLFVSGYTDEAVQRHGVLAASSLFLQKPFTPADLAAKVREALAERRPVTGS